MIGANHVLLVGEVADIRKSTPKVLNMRVKVTEQYIDRDGQPKHRSGTHKVTVFGEGKVTYLDGALTVGSFVVVTGRLENSSYEDKQGIKHWETKVTAIDVTPMNPPAAQPSVGVDEIPF